MSSNTSRRTFVKALAAGGLLAGFGLWRTPVWAITSLASRMYWRATTSTCPLVKWALTSRVRHVPP
ncbi:twin-arginine translocation signal domain-containing protein [Pseudomonas laurentiana]|uniref:Twin-arginine translocation signal domain-containing protein n=1 Tax=Pseudomonas laurentiana TaxID=2364649 RepID=A0A6I5RUX5_9PSED|nr:twin-arginine translocation signal domain-containing protein [Pseudomonas laurentiana]